MTLESVGIVLGTAILMGIGFRIGSDIYDRGKTKVTIAKSTRLLKAGSSPLRTKGPLRLFAGGASC